MRTQLGGSGEEHSSCVWVAAGGPRQVTQLGGTRDGYQRVQAGSLVVYTAVTVG